MKWRGAAIAGQGVHIRVPSDRTRACVQAEAKRIAFVGLVALSLIAHAAQASIFVEDRREQRDATLPIPRSVGVLHHPEANAGGTAFLVSSCHVAT
jgi:hypothetical protein